MPKFNVRLILDETETIEAEDEEEAIEKAWDLVFATGSYGSEVNEIEDDDEEAHE